VAQEAFCINSTGKGPSSKSQTASAVQFTDKGRYIIPALVAADRKLPNIAGLTQDTVIVVNGNVVLDIGSVATMPG
jgi:hypothetical protein